MPIQKGFVHTVFFWLKEKENDEHRKALHAGVLKLAENELIQTAFVGQPADTNREVIDSSYDFSITFIFENKADQDAYQTHPKHLEFIDNCAQYWSKVQVYDAVS
ncbi:Dabb family protein [Jiulongibacter sp. NS-SX5]|uniref:Dabb family protein n=1 Tax=Jiulongibacter sp. NS-SX5 TaxID=3463854 RepID=UPI004058BF96